MERTTKNRAGRVATGADLPPPHRTRVQRLRARHGRRCPGIHDPTARVRQVHRQASPPDARNGARRAVLPAPMRRPQLRRGGRTILGRALQAVLKCYNLLGNSRFRDTRPSVQFERMAQRATVSTRLVRRTALAMVDRMQDEWQAVKEGVPPSAAAVIDEQFRRVPLFSGSHQTPVEAPPARSPQHDEVS